MTWKTKLLCALAALAAVGTLLAAGADAFVRWRIERISPLKLGMAMRPPSGMDITGTPLSEAELRSHSCHVVRFMSVGCKWCRRDAGLWKELREALLAQGCDAILLGPRIVDYPQGQDASPHETQLAITSMEFARSLPLSGTPTTLVFDADWRLIWFKIGALKRQDVLRATGRLPRR